MMPLPRRPFEVVQGGLPAHFQGDLNGEMQEIAGNQIEPGMEPGTPLLAAPQHVTLDSAAIHEKSYFIDAVCRVFLQKLISQALPRFHASGNGVAELLIVCDGKVFSKVGHVPTKDFIAGRAQNFTLRRRRCRSQQTTKDNEISHDYAPAYLRRARPSALSFQSAYPSHHVFQSICARG